MAVQKTLWHSAAAQLGQIEVTVKSASRKSKYEGKPDYVELMIDGNLRHYQVEAPSCGTFFADKIGQTILIEFRDSRENATIHQMGPSKGGQQQPSQQPAAPTNVSPQSAPTTNQPPASTASATTNQPAPKRTAEEQANEAFAKNVAAVKEAKKFASRKVNAFEVIFKAVDHLAERRSKGGRALTPEHYQGIVTSIFIAMDRAGMTDTLPIGELDKYLPAEQPKQ